MVRLSPISGTISVTVAILANTVHVRAHNQSAVHKKGVSGIDDDIYPGYQSCGASV